MDYRKGTVRQVVIIRAASLIHTRMSAAVARIVEDAEFAEGHEIDEQTVRRVPKAILGKVLTRQEAERVLQKLEQT